MTGSALCGCGKPTGHGGMCSAKWAVRKAKYGPTGIKPKEPPVAPVADVSREAIARRLFGDLADDVLLLRDRGHTVARFKGDFRVDEDVLSAEQLRAKAKALRTKKVSRAVEVVDGKQAGRGGAIVCRHSVDPPLASESETKAGLAGEADAPASILDPSDLRARIAQLEQRVEFLLAVVADAIQGRRATLIDQATGLAKLETQLRTAA